MASQEPENDCLTCNWQVGAEFFSVQNDQNSTIADVLKKHFWFTEDDLHGAMVCRTCWDQMHQFHQFYISVENLYHNRLASVIVKPEPAAIENDCLEMSSSNPDVKNLLQEYSIHVKEEPSLEIFDGNESNDVKSSDAEYDEDWIGPDNVQQQELHCRKYKPREQRLREQAELEENYIKGHFKYICNNCGENSSSFGTHLKHYLDEHEVVSTFVECCGKRYFKRGRLFQHVQFLNNPDIFRCKQCGRRFGNNSALLTHMKEMHATGKERSLKCDQCPRTFVLPSTYRRHIKVHLKKELKQRFPCTNCSKTFSSSRLQRDHLAAAHEGINLYKCPFCVLSFYCSANMHKHKKLKHPNELMEERKLRD